MEDLLDMIPVWDYDEVVASSEVTAVAGCPQFSATGTASGTVHIVTSDKSCSSMDLSRGPVSDMSIDALGETLCAIVGETVVLIELVPTCRVRDLKPKIEYNHFPITCIAISPMYSETKRIVVGGASGDLIVLSQQGPPYAPVAVSKTDSRGPVTAVDWRGAYLIWSGPEFGVKVLNTVTGQRIAHLHASSGRDSALAFIGRDRWLHSSGYRLTLLEMRKSNNNSHDECVVKLSIDLPADQFAPNSDLGSLMKNREKLVGFGAFDETEMSLSIVSNNEGRISCHVIDTVNKDIPISEMVVEKSQSSCACRYVAGNSPYLLISHSGGVLRATRRSVETNAVWLIDKGMYEEAIRLLKNVKDSTVRCFVANRALEFLIRTKTYDKIADIVPQIRLETAGQWRDFIMPFLCVSKGVELSRALKALVPVIPYPPRDGVELSMADYGEILTILLDNAEHSFTELLESLRRWPAHLIDSSRIRDALIDLVPEDFGLDKAEKSVFIPGTISAFPTVHEPAEKVRSIALLLSLKHCYDNMGKYGDSLDILMKLGCEAEIFSLLNLHVSFNIDVRSWFEVNILSLFLIDAVNTSIFLIDNALLFPRESIVEEISQNPFFLHVYLRESLFRNPESTRDYHDSQIPLFLQFDKSRVVDFLRLASAYDAQRALGALRTEGRRTDILVEAEAVVLWKLGNHSEAIKLLLAISKDVKAAIKFASSISDSNIWKSIQDHALGGTGSELESYIEAVTDSSAPSLFSAERTFLATDAHRIKSARIARVVGDMLVHQERKLRILESFTKILENEWGLYKDQPPPWSSGTWITKTTPCRVCGGPVTRLPPGDDTGNTDLEALPDTVMDICGYYGKAGATLGLVSRKEQVHARCLVRTAVETVDGNRIN